MHRSHHRIAFGYPEHPVRHHNPRSALHHVVRDLTGIQLSGDFALVAVHPLHPFCRRVLFLAQIGVPDRHAVRQYDLLLFEGDTFIHELFAAVKG